jgi:hypothetical protein
MNRIALKILERLETLIAEMTALKRQFKMGVVIGVMGIKNDD